MATAGMVFPWASIRLEHTLVTLVDEAGAWPRANAEAARSAAGTSVIHWSVLVRWS